MAKYYEYEINYDSKNGEMDCVTVPHKMSEGELLTHLQDEGLVESFEPRDFEATEITKKEYEEYYS